MIRIFVVPKKGSSNVRGNALGPPGDYHDPIAHNTLEMKVPDAERVYSDQAMHYRTLRSSDAEVEQALNPWRSIELDSTFRLSRERSHHLVTICSSSQCSYT